MASLLPEGLNITPDNNVTLLPPSQPPKVDNPPQESSFDDEVQQVFKREGRYANNRYDRGGRTMYGISEKSHPEAWANGPPTKDMARTIYKTKYWDRIKGDALPRPVASVMFDNSILSGPNAAVEDFNKVVGNNEGLTQNNLNAVWTGDPVQIAKKLTGLRIDRYNSIVNRDSTQEKHYSGWVARATQAFHDAIGAHDILGENKFIGTKRPSLTSFSSAAKLGSSPDLGSNNPYYKPNDQLISEIENAGSGIKDYLVYAGHRLLQEKSQANDIKKNRRKSRTSPQMR